MRANFKVGAAVGSGVVARAAEDGGADFLLAINAGRMRNMGMPSIACMLPIRDATEATLPFAVREVLPQAKVPVYVGLSVWSTLRESRRVIRSVLDAGFTGVANFPSTMHFSRGMRRLLNRAGLGTQAEISLLRQVQRAGGRTLFYCGTQDDARSAAEAGLGAVVFNFGWNVGGADSHTAEISLEEAAQKARQATRLVRRLRPGTEVFLEGGPILTAEDLNFIIRYADIDGYVGGSTIDRFPVQHSVANQIAEYKSAARTTGPRTQEMLEALAEAARFGLLGKSEELAQFAVSLVRAREGQAHIHLVAPPGADTSSAINLLSTRGPRRNSVQSFDFGQSSSAHRLNDLLFGRADSALRNAGILEGGADFVVLHNCDAMPRLVQRKLRTSMLTGRIQRIGSRASRPLECRLVFVSGLEGHANWGDAPVARIRYPSLKARHLDVRMLLEHMLGKFTSQEKFPTIQPAAYRELSAHDWPGNEAELRTLVTVLASRAAKNVYEAHDMRMLLGGTPFEPKQTTAQEAMRQQLLQALVRNGFRKGATARAMNISRKTLYNRMRRLGLN